MTRFMLSALIAGTSALWAPAAAPEAPLEPPLKDSDRSFWAFRAPILPKIPKTKNSTWVRNPVDAFILAKLDANGLTPSKPADTLSLLRRVTFDLTGLPPTDEEIDRFLKHSATRPDEAYENLVDRLLASPHYGERWGQHWLDVARYAESNGYEVDAERPSAWRFRDYVVQSLNDDKPFDRFLREQIAGDLLAAGKDTRINANLWVATGLHRCGPIHIVSGNVDPEENRNEVLTEMVLGVGSTFLGLTMNCARCHDHKFDPISQADYYRLEAFFAATRPKEVDFSTAEERSAHQLKLLNTMAKLAPIKAKVAALDAPYQEKIAARKKASLEPKYRDALAVDKKKRTPEQEKLANDAQTLIKVSWDEILAELTLQDRERRAELRAEQHAIEAELPMPPSQAWAVVEEGKTPPTYVLKRGEVKKKGPIVEPAFPRILIGPETGPGKQQVERLTRKNLADWLVTPDHPLTARVFVNRLWQHHFGHGIVATPNDFGSRGARPTHPELLDWLAVEFVRSGWRIKHMHRLMVLSATYRQSSKYAEADRQSIDPDNKLLGRMNRRRLEGETIRDAILAAAGTLNREMGGPMVRVPLEPEVYDLIFTEGEPDGLWPVTTDAKQHTRRSLYLFAKRNVRQPLLEAFDQPDRLTSCGDRAVSTFAPQALILMNGPLAQSQSRAMAASLIRRNLSDPDKWIEAACRRCFGRLPTADERGAGRTFLREQAESVRSRLRSGRPASVPDKLPADADVAAAVALADYCLALFNTNEFVYVP
jgi:Protein of unknown function (DUF1553)/Protein of unknown function (DUF1549)